MISREKMDKIVPIVQAAIVAVYLFVYIVSDILHVKRMMKKAKKTIEK
jgi:hypothetical protein